MYPESVSRILARAGFACGRGGYSFVRGNDVRVNGIRIHDHRFTADAERDEISVNGEKLPPVRHIYLMMNKPAGFVCAHESGWNPTVYSLTEEIAVPSGLTLNSVGRLDRDTEGLLLLTTNGSFSHALMQPEFHVRKVYRAVLSRDMTESERKSAAERCLCGITVPPDKKSPEFVTRPSVLEWESPRSCTITVTEGKFHLVRRIFSALGNDVTSLLRISIGSLILDQKLASGEFRALSGTELTFPFN